MSVSFGDFALDEERRQLLRSGEPVPLGAKAYELLGLLLVRRPRVLSKAQISGVLWPGTSVGETSLPRLVTELRQALGDDAQRPRFIRTAHGFGYAFCGEARENAQLRTGESGGAQPGTAGTGALVRTPAEERPYPGLSAFTENEAEQFFGREAEVASLWGKVQGQKLLALIGPSGVGKTSFVRAGVIAQPPEGWATIYMTPGANPVGALARELTPKLASVPEGMADLVQGVTELLQRGDAARVVSAVSRWRLGAKEALLVIDQFEELFTLNAGETQARLAMLLGRLTEEAGVHVLLSLRDDFLFRCHSFPELSPVFDHVTPLGPPSSEALRRALVEPAARYRLRFQDETLVDEMVGTVAKERGALPLLAFAASRLWEERDRERKLLTRAAYERISGVAGALVQHAEATLADVGAEREGVIRELFRNLVTAEGTRAEREREELLSVFPAAAGKREEAEAVLDVLVGARLLTEYVAQGEGEGGGRQRIEIVHESLLTRWPRLVRWQAQDEEGAVLRDQLRQAAQLWQDRGKADDLLWSGTALQDFARWRQRYPTPLTSTEDEFARAMETKATRRRRRRRAVGAAVLGIAATVALATSLLWQRADASRRNAEAATLRAEAGKLLAVGERELERYPTAALAYTLKALELADTEGARLLALRVLQRAPMARLAPERESVVSVFSPSGEWVALGGWTKVQLLHKDGGPARLLGEFPTKGMWLMNVQFGPASDVVMAEHRGEVRLWSVPEGRELRRLQVEGASHLFEGGLLNETQAGTRTVIRRWSRESGEFREIGSMEAFPPIHDFGGGWLAYARGRRVFLRSYENWRSPPLLLAELTAEVRDLSLSADGKRIALSDASGAVRIGSTSATPFRSERVLRVESGRLASGRWFASRQTVAGHPRLRLFDLEAPSRTEPVAVTRADTDFPIAGQRVDPSGQWLVTTHNQQGTALWWLGGVRPSVLIVSEDAERERIRDLAFTPDGRWLLSVSMTGTVRAWPMSARDEPRVLLGAVDWSYPVIAAHPAGRQVAVGLSGGRVFLVGMEAGPPRELRGFSSRVGIGALAFGDGGRLLAAAPNIGPRDEKVVRVFDLDTGAERTFGPLPGVGEGEAGGIRGLEFVDRDRLLASVTGAGLLSVDLATGEIRSLAAQPTGRFRLSLGRRIGLGINERGTGDSSASLLRFSLDGSASTSLGAYENPTAVAVDTSGTLVAAGSADGTVRMGPVAGGEPHVFFGHESPVAALAFSPDGRWLASTTNDRSIWLWPVPAITNTPLHKRPYQELLALLRSHTNLRAVPDVHSATGYKLEPGPFPGWAKPPEW